MCKLVPMGLTKLDFDPMGSDLSGFRKITWMYNSFRFFAAMTMYRGKTY